MKNSTQDKILRIVNLFINNPSYYKSNYNAISSKAKVKEHNLIILAKDQYKKNYLDKKFNIDNKIDKPGVYWVSGCIHAPFQNKPMYESTINFLKSEVNLEGIVLAGDIIDLNSLSAHDKGKIPIPGVTLDWEYQESNKFLDQIDELNIKTKKYLFGNHEDRYNRAIKDVDISKYGSALKSPQKGLKLTERGYDIFTDWKNDYIAFGDSLLINHGEFLLTHVAKKTIDVYRKSVMFFHTHRFQVYVEGLVGGWNMGAGADFNSPVFNYASKAMKTSWMNSSALVTLDNEGFYHTQPLLFINNKLIVNGKQY